MSVDENPENVRLPNPCASIMGDLVSSSMNLTVKT